MGKEDTQNKVKICFNCKKELGKMYFIHDEYLEGEFCEDCCNSLFDEEDWEINGCTVYELEAGKCDK